MKVHVSGFRSYNFCVPKTWNVKSSPFWTDIFISPVAMSKLTWFTKSVCLFVGQTSTSSALSFHVTRLNNVHAYGMMTSSNGNIFRVTGYLCGEFPAQRPVTRSVDVFFGLRLNKRLSKQSWGWWFKMTSRPFWRLCNGVFMRWIRRVPPSQIFKT